MVRRTVYPSLHQVMECGPRRRERMPMKLSFLVFESRQLLTLMESRFKREWSSTRIKAPLTVNKRHEQKRQSFCGCSHFKQHDVNCIDEKTIEDTMTQSRRSLKIPVGPLKEINAGNSVDRTLERSDTVTLLELTGSKDTPTLERPGTICTRKRWFISSLALVAAIMGTLIVVFVSRAGDDGGESTPDFLSRTTQATSPTTNCSECVEEGYFCLFPERDCGAAGEGNCTRKPEMCTLDYNPVCGCDGVTYSNSCSAASKGVSVVFHGECDTPSQGCSDCEGEDVVCVFPEGDCGVLLAGECIPKPTECNRMEAPVCGCDGISYANGCIAFSEGASIYAQGECVPSSETMVP
jgi:hypothetical protein